MNLDDSKEITVLFQSVMELLHEKIFTRPRQECTSQPLLKKNQLKILMILSRHNHITLTEIGKSLNIEKGSLTTLVDGLVENNLVIRSNDLNDRRKSIIFLSPSGKEMADKVLKFYSYKINELLRDIDSGEYEQFRNSLQFVVQFLNKV